MSSIKQNEEVKGSAEALRQDKSSKLFKKQADLLPQESKVIDMTANELAFLQQTSHSKLATEYLKFKASAAALSWRMESLRQSDLYEEMLLRRRYSFPSAKGYEPSTNVIVTISPNAR